MLQSSIPNKTNEENGNEVNKTEQDLLFDKHRHRRHLGHFYVQDSLGAGMEEKKRQKIKDRAGHFILFKLASAVSRGIGKFIIFLFHLILKVTCIQFKKNRQYEEMQVL